MSSGDELVTVYSTTPSIVDMRDALLLMVSVTEDEKCVTNRKVLSCFPDLFIILQFCSGVKRSVPVRGVFLLNRFFFINIRSYLTLRK